MSIPNLFCIEYGHLDFSTKHDFWKRPFNLSTHNLLCIEYGHLDLSRHDLGKALSYFHPKFTLLCMPILTLEQILISVLVLDVLKYFKKK